MTDSNASKETGPTMPRCDMTKACSAPVTHIGSKGYVYCSEHAARRKASGYERCRKLRPFECELLAAGKPLPSYELKPAPAPATEPDLIFRLDTDDGGTGDQYKVHAGTVRGWHYINEHAERPFRFSDRTHAVVPERAAYDTAVKPAADAGLRVRFDFGITPEPVRFLCACGRPYHGTVCAFPPLVTEANGK